MCSVGGRPGPRLRKTDLGERIFTPVTFTHFHTAHSTCPGSLHRSSLLPFIYPLKQILAWLCPNSTTSSAATSTNTLTLHVSLPGTSTKPTSEKSCQTSTNIYPVQQEDRIHWIIATPSLRMPTKLVHCRLLANQIMSPFFSHRNTNNGSLMNHRWRGSDALVLPL